MSDTKTAKKNYPVCKEHWNRMRQEAFSTLPFWSRLLAGPKVKKMLNEKGFVLSSSECRFCKRKRKSEKSS